MSRRRQQTDPREKEFLILVLLILTAETPARRSVYAQQLITLLSTWLADDVQTIVRRKKPGFPPAEEISA